MKQQKRKRPHILFIVCCMFSAGWITNAIIAVINSEPVWGFVSWLIAIFGLFLVIEEFPDRKRIYGGNKNDYR